jgi:hypothetical protein
MFPGRDFINKGFVFKPFRVNDGTRPFLSEEQREQIKQPKFSLSKEILAGRITNAQLVEMAAREHFDFNFLVKDDPAKLNVQDFIASTTTVPCKETFHIPLLTLNTHPGVFTCTNGQDILQNVFYKISLSCNEVNHGILHGPLGYFNWETKVWTFKTHDMPIERFKVSWTGDKKRGFDMMENEEETIAKEPMTVFKTPICRALGGYPGNETPLIDDIFRMAGIEKLEAMYAVLGKCMRGYHGFCPIFYGELADIPLKMIEILFEKVHVCVQAETMKHEWLESAVTCLNRENVMELYQALAKGQIKANDFRSGIDMYVNPFATRFVLLYQQQDILALPRFEKHGYTKDAEYMQGKVCEMLESDVREMVLGRHVPCLVSSSTKNVPFAKREFFELERDKHRFLWIEMNGEKRTWNSHMIAQNLIAKEGVAWIHKCLALENRFSDVELKKIFFY